MDGDMATGAHRGVQGRGAWRRVIVGERERVQTAPDLPGSLLSAATQSFKSCAFCFACTPVKTGVLRHLYISGGHNFFGHYGKPPGEHPMEEVRELRCVAGAGIEGDRFFNFKPDYKGQITFFAMEVYVAACARFGVKEKPPSVFRRNVIVEGMDLMALVGAEFEVQGVRFAGTGESAPCEWMNLAFAPGAEEFLKGKGGLRARILTSGWLRCGPAIG